MTDIDFDRLIPVFFIGKKWKIPIHCLEVDCIESARIVCRGDGWQDIQGRAIPLGGTKPYVNSPWALGLAIQNLNNHRHRREGVRGKYANKDSKKPGEVTIEMVEEIRNGCDEAAKIGIKTFYNKARHYANKFSLSSKQSLRIARRETYNDTYKKSDANAYWRKFTDEEIRNIRRMHAEGATHSIIIERYKMASGTLYDIVKRKTYKDVN